jgi:hypothetical protein
MAKRTSTAATTPGLSETSELIKTPLNAIMHQEIDQSAESQHN